MIRVMIVLKGPRGAPGKLVPAQSVRRWEFFEDREGLGERCRTIVVLHHSYRTTYGIAVPQPCVLAKSGPERAPNPDGLLRLPNLPLTRKNQRGFGPRRRERAQRRLAFWPL